jgi:hypothetical protein
MPKILLIDIETAPILGDVWNLFDQNVALNQIVKDWHLLSFCAKWLDEKEVIYYDQRNASDIENDKDLIKKLWKLLDEADIVIGHNSKNFDIPKINARIIMHELPPPSTFRQIDTLQIARKFFDFTSNKLEYLTGKLCKKYKKLKHNKFPGHDLWRECLKGNREAWNKMKEYNIHDVLALEELYHKLQAWDTTINFSVYSDSEDIVCNCGHTEFKKNGFKYLTAGKYQRYTCKKCGSETRDNINLLSKDKRKSLRRSTGR